jgi:hypothetical protein
MLAPADHKPVARPTSKELKAEADRWRALYKERPEDSVYHHRLDANGKPVFPLVARHVNLVGADIWNGVSAEKKSACGCLTHECKHRNKLVNARPVGGGQWIATLRTYHPARPPSCECPACAWSGPALLDLHANEPPEPARLLPWSTPALVELDAEDEHAARLADGFRDGALLLDAFKWIAGWQRFLPGLGKGSDDPFARVLRISFWLRNLHRVTSGDDPWTVDDLAEACRVLRPDRKVQREAFITPGGERHPRDAIVVPPEWRRIIARDIAATRWVISYTYEFLLPHDLAVKGRWRALLPDGVSYVTSGAIVKLMLEEGLSARQASKRLGLSGSIVARNFNAAVDAVAESLGPWPWPLSSQKGKFARRVGTRRAERTDHPRLRIGDRPAPLPPSWRICGPPTNDWKFGVPKEVLPLDRLLIGEAMEYFGNFIVRPGWCHRSRVS